jgi:hypothetical protein
MSCSNLMTIRRLKPELLTKTQKSCKPQYLEGYIDDPHFVFYQTTVFTDYYKISKNKKIEGWNSAVVSTWKAPPTGQKWTESVIKLTIYSELKIPGVGHAHFSDLAALRMRVVLGDVEQHCRVATQWLLDRYGSGLRQWDQGMADCTLVRFGVIWPTFAKVGEPSNPVICWGFPSYTTAATPTFRTLPFRHVAKSGALSTNFQLLDDYWTDSVRVWSKGVRA